MKVETRGLEDALKAPFREEDLEWRLQASSKAGAGRAWAICLCYVSARAIEDRLDEVFGIDGWYDEYTQLEGGKPGFMCTLAVKTGDEHHNMWVSKQDVSELTDVEPLKGGVSGALKRAAVKFGIGRYLYNLEANFAVIDSRGKFKGPKGTDWKWSPPPLPAWALPSGVSSSKEAAPKKAKKTTKKGKKEEATVIQLLDAVENSARTEYGSLLEYLGLSAPKDKSLLTRPNMQMKLDKELEQYQIDSAIEWVKSLNEGE